MLKSRFAAAVLVGLGFAGSSQAASISYFLNNSDKLPDGTNYLLVTMSDGLNGAVNFTVDVLQPLVDLAATTGFGITKFAFNVAPGTKLTPNNVDISGLPKGWVKGPHQPMDGFGKYDMRLRITNARTPHTPSISFSIIGIDFDTLLSYVDLASGSSEGPSFFSARVDGLTLGCEAGQPQQPVPLVGKKSKRTSSRSVHLSTVCKPTDAFFGGATSAVPAPPALWLLGTGIAGLVVRRFRSARSH
jgi:hypothetical protein